MPRPIRIEYENAYYHVMNRGRARQKLFHSADYFDAFLKTVEEAHTRLGVQVLSYCLMSNHYHLQVKTPEANLGRVMRHINGVYTQRYNRLKKTDGPLFRGRYQAILVEKDAYQLQLSRYIHLNPLEAKMVSKPEDYPWSSYPAYLGHCKPPDWLYCQEIYAQLGVKSRFKAKYKAFVELGVDEEIKQFYGKGHIRPYLGSAAFRDWIYKHRKTEDEEVSKAALSGLRPGLDEITARVGAVFGVDKNSIVTGRRGVAEKNIPRWVAMYLCRDIGGHKLTHIAEYFGLKRIGSISNTIAKLNAYMEDDQKLARTVATIKSGYDT
ncbi:MAG: transposase [Gammaproteobacteria bacterium]